MVHVSMQSGQDKARLDFGMGYRGRGNLKRLSIYMKYKIKSRFEFGVEYHLEHWPTECGLTSLSGGRPCSMVQPRI